MKKALVIDDEEKIRNIYRSLLTAENFEVFEAASAVDGYEILREEKIDLILLDIAMPEVDGGCMHDVIETFHRYTRVIVCSVFSLEEQHRLIQRAADYYDKSQGIEVLREKIEKIMGLEVL